MAMLADTTDAVIGVDTHTDTHTACMLDRLGRQIAVVTAAADPEGCRMLLAWAARHAPGPRLAWAVEGTRSHGLGLTRVLQAEGQLVVEAGRPARASKRPGGKSDPADALQAARNALAAEHHAQPRADGAREALRILLAARAQASTARTALWQPGARLDMFFCRHCSASRPPGCTLEQCAIKSERQAERIAPRCASVGACENAGMTREKVAAAVSAASADTCLDMLLIS